MAAISDTVELGKIVGVWGVKGWVKLHSYTRERADIALYKDWLLTDGRQTPETFKVTECRVQGQGVVAKLEGIDDRNQAELLIGRKILVAQQDLPALPEGEFYWSQLIGLDVVGKGGDRIGTLDSIIETGANDVLVVKQVATTDEQSERPDVLIPYLSEVVLEVDLQEKTMLVDWDPAYLLDS